MKQSTTKSKVKIIVNNTTQFKHAVSTKIVMNASQQQAWQVLQDFSNVHTWAPSVSDSYQIGNKEKGVGHGRHCDIDGFGGLDEIITQWDEGEGFQYTVTPLGPLDASRSQWKLVKVDDRHTRLEVSLSYNLRFGLFGKILHALVMKNKLQKSLGETGMAVKDRVESQAAKSMGNAQELNAAGVSLA